MPFNYDSTWDEQGSAPSTPAAGKWKIYPKSDGFYAVDDAGAEYGPFAVGTPTQAEIFLTSAGGWPSTTNGCALAVKTEYGTNDIDLYVMAFDQSAAEYAQWTVWMPDDWDGGTMTFKAVWTSAAGTVSQTVEWNMQGRAFANDDAIDQAWGSSVEVSDALLANGDVHYSAVSSAVTLSGGPLSGELVQFRAWRDASNDTLAGDALLIGLKVYYTRS